MSSTTTDNTNSNTDINLAQEFKKNADNYNCKNWDKDFEIFLNDLKEKSLEGSYGCLLYLDSNAQASYMKEKLQTLGFKVKICEDDNIDIYLDISWRDFL